MSLDVYLEENGKEVFSANITHNLKTMAEEAGIYEHLWQPEKIGIATATELIEPVSAGLALMIADPDRFKRLEASNGWGKWRDFVPWIAEYLAACRKHPYATVSVSR